MGGTDVAGTRRNELGLMIVRNPTLQEIAAILDNSKIRGGVLRACCPAHGGEDANLSLRYDGDKLLAQCHSHHCAFEAIMAAIRDRLGEPAGGEVVEITRNGRPLSERKAKPKNDTVRNRTVWELRDEVGKLVALHVRDDLADGEKKVWWRLPSGKTGLEGKSTSDLPLYGCQDIVKTSVEWVVVAEGEKAADVLRGSQGLREAGVAAVGTVTGANGTPGAEALGALRGRRVVLWPDSDSTGLDHMGRIAQALQGVAAEVRWFEWEEAPEKGDAADHPDIGSLAPTLKIAPRWSKPPAIEGLIFNMGDRIRRGVEPPEELLPDILLKSKAHNIYAPGGVGKTWLLVWLAKELVAQGNKVLVFDLENGERTYLERLEEVAADLDALNEKFAYGGFLSLEPDKYAQFLDEWQPDIVMFDSWIGFLAADGRDENVSNDISAWAEAYSKPALRRGVAILTLDHVPHEHERERGSSRKRDEMDVVWKLTKIGDFDRDKTATLSLTRQKDREGWLPEKLTFEIGGDPDEGFVMRRDDSLARRVEVTHLSTNERVALDTLKTFGEGGATTAEWLDKAQATGAQIRHKQSLHNLRRSLVAKGKVEELNGRYAAVKTQDVEGVSGVSGVYEDTLDISENQGPPGGVSGVHPLKGGGVHTDTPPLRHESLNSDEGVSSKDVPFTELSIEEKRKRFRESAARAYPGKEKDNDPVS